MYLSICTGNYTKKTIQKMANKKISNTNYLKMRRNPAKNSIHRYDSLTPPLVWSIAENELSIYICMTRPYDQ